MSELEKQSMIARLNYIASTFEKVGAGYVDLDSVEVSLEYCRDIQMSLNDVHYTSRKESEYE